jgi:ATP-dependent Lon protease
MGLGWTAMGGLTLYIETARRKLNDPTKGKYKVKLSDGSLELKESLRNVYSI